jgi:hypothetical protein
LRHPGQLGADLVTMLGDGAVLEREAGTGSGWMSLPVTFRRR